MPISNAEEARNSCLLPDGINPQYLHLPNGTKGLCSYLINASIAMWIAWKSGKIHQLIPRKYSSRTPIIIPIVRPNNGSCIQLCWLISPLVVPLPRRNFFISEIHFLFIKRWSMSKATPLANAVKNSPSWREILELSKTVATRCEVINIVDLPGVEPGT